jgi:3-oxoacyl-[acyl-carrier protein] reductase/meso-butanediol dehydrogenase/(S,S)-butanediol dehydrogenase/diacetyl reductase
MSQTVVITGGSKGIGWELVQAFAGEGFNVVSGSRTIRSDVPEKIANRVKQVEIDVKNKKDHYKLVTEANNWSGSLDCYINNAGYSEWRELKNIDENFLTNIFETNLFSYFWGAQAAASSLSKGGSIINISSLAAKRGTTNNSAYSATKFGVTALTQSLCKELGTQGIRVNAVCPGVIETPMIDRLMNSDKSIRSKISIEGFSERVITYACEDVKFLSSIKEQQLAKLHEPDLIEVLNLENDVIKVFALMEYNGILLNVDKSNINYISIGTPLLK